jgi:dienelactone hydrolase
MPIEMQRQVVDHIPVLWCAAKGRGTKASRDLVIWLPGFGGTKESVAPQLRDLAAAGFIGLSYDPWQHGERRVETLEELRARVASNVRRHFWPILAQTAEEVSRIIDWAIDTLKIAPYVRMGGISMGGDISVAAAGLEGRILSVAASVATPDWLRPNSHEKQGTADSYANRFYERWNPLTHPGNYAHCPAITFQCGAGDTLVPPEGAQHFATVMRETYAACPERLNVTLHPGVQHAFTPVMWENSLAWFKRW